MDREIIKRIREPQIFQQKLDEFQGILRGVIADGRVNAEEVQYLLDWLVAHPEPATVWPASEVEAAIVSALEDDKLTQEELDDLTDLVQRLAPPLRAGPAIPTARWDEREEVDFWYKEVVLTGDFIYGTRRKITEVLAEVGAKVVPSLRKKTTDYLVVGYRGSDLWKHGNFGTKIAKALAWQSEGCNIAVITEEVWYNSMLNEGVV